MLQGVEGGICTKWYALLVSPIFLHVVGPDTLSFVLSILNDGVSLECVNQTFITLFPKVVTPLVLKNFDPLADIMWSTS